MESYVSQRPEDVKRNRGRNVIENRGNAEENKKKLWKTGLTAKKAKAVTFEDPDEESDTGYSRETEERPPAHLIGKKTPYVDLPPLKAVMRSSVKTAVKEPDRGDQTTKIAPAYKSIAPIDDGVDIGKLIDEVLDAEVTMPLRTLAAVSDVVKKEIKAQVTKARVPVNNGKAAAYSLTADETPRIEIESLPLSSFATMTEVSDQVPEGHMVASDPILQYLTEHGDEILSAGFKVAKESEPLRAIHMKVNGEGPEECIHDNGSMIVSMARPTAVRLGLHWDPSVAFNMESASGHFEKTLGIARNICFTVGGLSLYLQVHILENPPYSILLGRPFETFTNSVVRTRGDGSSEVSMTDPNSGKTVTVPTYMRGQGPKDSRQQQYQGFC